MLANQIRLLQNFALLLQIFALLSLLFGINCTEIDQSHSSIISIYIITKKTITCLLIGADVCLLVALYQHIMARNDGHACAQRLVNKQHFYQTSMLKFIGVTLGK